MPKKHKIFIIAGESSGDNLGSRLMLSLQSVKSAQFSFYGIGGERMQKVGMSNLFPIEDLAVMGFTEVLPKIPRIIYRMRQVFKYIDKVKPDIIITIDLPGFNFRLVKNLRSKLNLKIPIIHYVAPTVWAYNPKRASIVAKLFDHILLLLPFEKKYFDAVNIPSTFVGHPIIEEGSSDISDQYKQEIKRKYHIENKKIITLFPGSRVFELKNHLPIFRQFIQLMEEKYPNDFKFCIPTLSNLKDKIKAYIGEDVIITDQQSEKDLLLSMSDLAICKSGTISLEVVKQGVPSILIYKFNKISAWWIKRKLKINYIALCNIILNQMVIPELLQENFTVDKLYKTAIDLLNNKQLRDSQIKKYNEALYKLKGGHNKKHNPSSIAADVVMSYLK